MTALIPELITGCDGASVTLRRRDHLITAAASDDTVRDLDYIQYRGDHGPCVDAANTGVQTYAAALADEQRWRSFTSQARKRGVESILSSPLIANEDSTGALNLYSRTPGAFPPIHQELADLFAQQTALLLNEPDPLTTAHSFDDRIHDALASREIIAQGQGVLMERLNVNARHAYLALRRDAVEISTSLRRQAAYVVADAQKPPAAPQPDGAADE